MISFSNKYVSVIIPCRNEEKRISACLESVLNFILPDCVVVEILVIDGSSTDNTLNIVRQYCDLHANIRLLSNPDIIQSISFNMGIKYSSGDYVIILSAHSVYPKNYLKLCYETMEKTKADVVGGIIITLPGNNSRQALVVQIITSIPFGVGNAYFRTKDYNGPVDTVPYGFYKKEIFKKVGLFDERLVRNQDYELNRRILKTGGLIWSNPEIKVSYFNQSNYIKFLKKQINLEAPYNAYMWYLAPYTLNIRHIITGFFSLGLITGSLLSIWSIYVRIIFFGVMLFYFFIALFTSVKSIKKTGRSLDFFVLPMALFLFHFVHGLGILKGIIYLIIGKSPVQHLKEPWPGFGKYRIKPKNVL